MIAPGSGSGAPGTGQRAESAALIGKGSFFFGLTAAGLPPVLPLSVAEESVIAESAVDESTTLSITGRAA
jgi:hypothetical protein